MPNNTLWAAVLSQLLILDETGCPHSARHAIRLLEQLCEFDELDEQVRVLCERAGQRLERRFVRIQMPLPVQPVCASS